MDILSGNDETGVVASVDEIEQRDTEYVSVPVRHDGPVTTHELPSRVGSVFTFGLSTKNQMVVGRDLKRKRITLVSDTAWLLCSGTNDAGATIPANVVLSLAHADAVYAKVSSSTADLSVIYELWAD